MSENDENLSVIKVGPYFYRIKPMPDWFTEDLEGSTDKKRTTIYLDTSLPHERREVVYWHELLHALCDLTSLGLTGEVEERLVDSLAPALVELLDDNAHIRWGWMKDRPEFGPDWDDDGDDDGGGVPVHLVVIQGGKGSA